MIPLKKPLAGNLSEPQPESESNKNSQSLTNTSDSPGGTSSMPAVTSPVSRRKLTVFWVVMAVVIGLLLAIYFLFVKEKKSGWEDDFNEWDTEYVEDY